MKKRQERPEMERQRKTDKEINKLICANYSTEENNSAEMFCDDSDKDPDFEPDLLSPDNDDRRVYSSKSLFEYSMKDSALTGKNNALFKIEILSFNYGTTKEWL